MSRDNLENLKKNVKKNLENIKKKLKKKRKNFKKKVIRYLEETRISH